MFFVFRHYPNCKKATGISAIGTVCILIGTAGFFVEPLGGIVLIISGIVIMVKAKQMADKQAQLDAQKTSAPDYINGTATQVANTPTSQIPGTPPAYIPANSSVKPQVNVSQYQNPVPPKAPTSTLTPPPAAALDPKETGLKFLTTGQEDLNAGKFQEALNCLKVAAGLIPENPGVWNLMGQANRNLGNMDEAISNYQKAISIDPENGIYQCNIGAAFLSAGRYEEAVANYQQGLPSLQLSSNQEGFAVALANYGLALGKCGLMDDAISCINEAERLGYKNGALIRQQLGI